MKSLNNLEDLTDIIVPEDILSNPDLSQLRQFEQYLLFEYSPVYIFSEEKNFFQKTKLQLREVLHRANKKQNDPIPVFLGEVTVELNPFGLAYVR